MTFELATCADLMTWTAIIAGSLLGTLIGTWGGNALGWWLAVRSYNKSMEG